MNFRSSPEEGDQPKAINQSEISRISYFYPHQIRQLNQNFAKKLNRRESNCGDLFIEIELGQSSLQSDQKLEKIKILREKINLNKAFIDKHKLTNTKQLGKMVDNMDWLIRESEQSSNHKIAIIPEEQPGFLRDIMQKIKDIFKKK